jgi:hypothetical protein
MKEAKNMFTDTQITTASFLKNCVRIPKREIRSESN